MTDDQAMAVGGDAPKTHVEQLGCFRHCHRWMKSRNRDLVRRSVSAPLHISCGKDGGCFLPRQMARACRIFGRSLRHIVGRA